MDIETIRSVQQFFYSVSGVLRSFAVVSREKLVVSLSLAGVRVSRLDEFLGIPSNLICLFLTIFSSLP
jgi:hypothetical protein